MDKLIPVYKRTSISPGRASFRNEEGEPWIEYRVPKDEDSVLNYAPGGGYCPKPSWVKI
jgi:hypothetical protein